MILKTRVHCGAAEKIAVQSDALGHTKQPRVVFSQGPMVSHPSEMALSFLFVSFLRRVPFFSGEYFCWYPNSRVVTQWGALILARTDVPCDGRWREEGGGVYHLFTKLGLYSKRIVPAVSPCNESTRHAL